MIQPRRETRRDNLIYALVLAEVRRHRPIMSHVVGVRRAEPGLRRHAVLRRPVHRSDHRPQAAVDVAVDKERAVQQLVVIRRRIM